MSQQTPHDASTSEASALPQRDWANYFAGDSRLIVLLIGLVLVGGLSSLAVLPRMEDPILRSRVAIIVTRLPGADAERVEALITEKLELRLREVDEIKEMRSQSRPGVSSITIELLDSIMDSAEIWSEVRGKINDVLPELPKQASRPQFDDLPVRAFASIQSVVWKAETPVDYAVLRRTARELQDRLQTLPGTESVDRFGDPGEEVLVTLDAIQAASLGLTATDISQQLQAFDAKDAAGLIRTPKLDLALEVQTQFRDLAKVSGADIRSKDGRFVALSQIADIQLTTPQPLPQAARHGTQTAITLGVLVRPEVRIDLWTQQMNRTIDEFRLALPQGIEIVSVLDQSRYVGERLESLLTNLIAGAIAVWLVVWLLMGWRSAIIVSAALPLTLLTVFFLMRIFDIPIHQMSITGLIIALGLLIDNAIVAVDEVTAERALGHSMLEAVSIAVRRLSVPLLGSTVTTALAFTPIVIMPGPAGEFVGSIATNVILAIFVSLFFSLTIIVALAGKYVTPRPKVSPAASFWRASIRYGVTLPRVTELYRRSLITTLHRPKLTLFICCIPPLLGFIVASQLPEQFFPPADRDQIHIELELPAGASIQDTMAVADKVDAVLKQFDISQTDWFFGESAPSFYYNVLANRKGMPNFGQAILRLPSVETADELIPQLQQQLDSRVAEARALVRQLEQGPPFDAPVEVRLFGPDVDTLTRLGDDVRSILVNLPEVTHTRSLLSESLPQVQVQVDEQSVQMAGLSPRSVASQIQASLDGVIGGSVIEDVEELPVRVRVTDASRGEMRAVQGIDLIGSRDQQAAVVPLRAVAQFSLSPEVGTIVRLNQRRMNEVSAYVAADVLPSTVVAAFKQRLDESKFVLPAGYELTYGGEASKRNDAVGNLLANVGVLVALMVAALVLSFGSFRMAAIIGVVGVLSIGLSLGSLWLGGYPFGFMAIIGTMGLIGVAINDSIMVLSTLEARRDLLAGRLDAMADTVIDCTRHVLATTLTTVAGFAPLILAGGKFWPPLAVSIAGGVVGATMLAIWLVPAAFVLLRCPQGVVASASPLPVRSEKELAPAVLASAS